MFGFTYRGRRRRLALSSGAGGISPAVEPSGAIDAGESGAGELPEILLGGEGAGDQLGGVGVEVLVRLLDGALCDAGGEGDICTGEYPPHYPA